MTVDDPLTPLGPYIFSDDLTLPDDYLSLFDDDFFRFTFNDDEQQNHPSNTEQFLNSTFNQSNPSSDLSSSDPQFIHEFTDFTPNSSGNQRSETVSEFLNIPSVNDSGNGFVNETAKSVKISENSPSELRNHSGCESEPAMICPPPDSGNSVINQKVLTKRKKENSNQVDEEDEKKKARLIRNRESAQLSRQRKKHYVEELEDKVKTMHATIQDLNARISYIVAENATLRQQMVGSGSAGGGGPVMYPPHTAMMAPTGYGYPWMPFQPYVVKSQGSQVPLVPIPRLKTQQTESSLKSKKDVKKTEGMFKTKDKTKKVASISFIGLLLFILIFGGLAPVMNVKFGGYHDKISDYKFYDQQHRGRVLMGDGRGNGSSCNASEPLVASLYVPRNDKLVKIDGDLIIYSVLASEKAVAFREEQGMDKKEDTGVALVPAIPISAVKRNDGRQAHMYRTLSDHQRALPSNEENLQSKRADGKLQQWFREGLSGLMLSSGMCSEVFQFDTSVARASGAIVPATSVGNITTTKNHHNSTYTPTMKNRRSLHGLPIPLSDSTTNITKEQVVGHGSNHKDHHKNKSVSSMMVSVLVDPREAGDGSDLDGMMGGGGGKGKSFSRIFVVVLLDSVKYVTYSCMLPLKGGSHLVTA